MGQIKGFKPAQKDAILKQANEFWDESTLFMDPFFERVNEFERLCRILLPKGLEDKLAEYPDRSALVPPDIYNNVASLRGHIRSAFFRKKPFYRLSIAGQPNIRDDRIKKAEQILQQMLDEENEGLGFVVDADKAVYQALYAGLTCFFTTWVRNWEKVPQRDPETQQILTDLDGRPVYRQEIVGEYAETKAIDIRRTRIDPSASEKRDIRLVGVHSLMHQSELITLRNNPDTHYEFDIEELNESTFDRTTYFEKLPSESETYSQKGLDSDRFGDRIVEVRSIRGLFRVPTSPGKPDEIRDLIVEIGNQKILMALKDNDLPLAGWDLFDWPAVDEQSDRLFAMGVVEPARDQFIEEFLKSNQSLDAANHEVYATFIADASAAEELGPYIESSADQIIKLDVASSGLGSVGDAMRPLERPQLGQNTFQHSQVLKRSVQQTMKLNDFTQGTDPSSTETATAVTSIVSGGVKLLEHLMEKLADTGFKPVMRKKLILWQFFKGDKEQTITMSDGQVVTVDPGELLLPYHIAVDTSVGLTHPSMQRRMVEVFPSIAVDPFYDPAVVRETLNDVLELPNRDRLLLNRELLKSQIDKESVALGKGIPQPVHPLDNHAEHIRGHVEYLDFIEQQGEAGAAAQQVSTELLMDHVTQHQGELEKISAALGNSKDLGGNVGNQVQPDAARRNAPARGATGNFTPSENRQ